MTTRQYPARIVGINGSLRQGSFTRRAVELALDGAQAVGAEVHLIDLRKYDLPFVESKQTGNDIPDVLKLRAEVQQAQGIILGTPEYHGSFSGVLKNALDLMSSVEFEGKIVGLVGVGGGRLGAINALNGLRQVGRSLHSWVIPEQVSIPEARRMFDAMGNLSDLRLEQALHEVGRQVARFAYLHGSEALLDSLRLEEPPLPDDYAGVE